MYSLNIYFAWICRALGGFQKKLVDFMKVDFQHWFTGCRLDLHADLDISQID